MNSYDLKAAVACALPGVTTQIVQVVDLAALDKTQLRRLTSACERGYTARCGYVSELVSLCAKQLGVAPPISVGKRTWSEGAEVYHKGIALPDDLTDRWMKVSDVRAALQFSQKPPNPNHWGPSEPPKSTRNQYGPDYLFLAGWDKASMPEFRKTFPAEVREACPDYAEGLKRLREFIASKPKFTFRTMNAGAQS